MANKASGIIVEGARVHNLKNISVNIPRNQVTVMTGISGSGKSSLAFDTIYAEGQRRYVESLSAYARQFLGKLQKPDVDMITGLAPAISIDQKTAARSPRSTVGTMSEVYDYIRLLFARVGTPHCPECKNQLSEVEVKKGTSGKLTKQLSCSSCGASFPLLSLGNFSFNSPAGACPDCQGLGKRWVFDPELVLPNHRLTLEEGAIRPWSRLGSSGNVVQDFLSAAKTAGIPTNQPIENLSAEKLRDLTQGTGSFPGVVNHLAERYRSTRSSYVKTELERYMVQQLCDSCNGYRLNPLALAVKIGDYSIVDLVKLTIEDALKAVPALVAAIAKTKQELAAPIIRDISARLKYLEQVGLSYLTLDRQADTLAGGEAQRIRLATQLGSGLAGVLYVLDEPSVGLHPENLAQLISTIKELRDLENTVIVVEHDPQIIREADYIIDIGPGAGVLGGCVVAEGRPEKFLQSKKSLTAAYLRGEKKVPRPSKRRSNLRGNLKITGATSNNLKDLSVSFPLQTLTCVTGVSGSGKSTLVQHTLARALAKHFHRSLQPTGGYKTLEGLELLDKVISVDQSPIGRTPRSNPATYTNVFNLIRDIFSSTPEAKRRKFGPGHFSFNVKGGRCEQCKGDGVIRHEMHFLPDMYVTCDICNGTRYKAEVLEVLYKDKSIAEVLAMSIDEAVEFFAEVVPLAAKLEVLASVGLGYLRLGQPATTLSGGEAQRIKLATELSRQSTGKTLYILDEPTTGLHPHDVACLLDVLQALVDKGNTVIVIEHNLDVVAASDWVIDMGPRGGNEGGQIVAAGTPEEVAQTGSVTGRYLKALVDTKTKTKKPELALATS